MRWLRSAGCLAGIGCLAAVCCAAASDTARASPRRAGSTRRVEALSPWEQAERGREELEAIPEPDRTHAQYTRALDAYRAIYHADPGSIHAAAAVYSVAELLAEQGRSLHDAGSAKAAIAQYEFLRKQYPGSSLRVQALLAEGQIAQIDLTDEAEAKERYQLLLKQYPRSGQAEEARAALASLVQGTAARSQAAIVEAAATATPPDTSVRERATAVSGATGGAKGTAGSTLPPMGPTSAANGRSASPAVAAPASAPANASSAGVIPLVGAKPDAAALAEVDAQTRPDGVDANGVRRIGKKAVVTGIRHWSTATYTRVAIDLGDSVTYEAARVPNPDRIYFDLHGTRLAQELAGKSFTVTDDGFLKKIRAAQFSDEMTRVVLDVNDVTEYSAFLLPNPYRLIIDIHGQSVGAKLETPAATQTAAPVPTVAGAAETPAPHAAGVVRSTPGKPVPNTMTSRQASATEVAAVSDVPGKVEATTKPTSQPISAVVGAGGQRRSNELDAVAGGAPNAAPHEASAPNSSADIAFPVPPKDEGSKKARRGSRSIGSVVASASPARAAVPTADGETSLVRALGLKIGRIVIDAGHGGHDSGTLGVDGLEEKDVVLDVALRVGKLLHDRLGAEVVYTRSDDTFIPLETRTAIANKAQADLFLSIHANSSSDSSARGVETYYLNFTSDPSAIETAARENAVSDQSIHQLSDLVKRIALKDKIAESREFASDVETSLYGGLARGNEGLKNRGVKKAPFVVLIGANMPSILAEISFVTNPRDAEQLRQPDYRQRVAESLYRGVARYEGGLSATRIPTERASAGQ